VTPKSCFWTSWDFIRDTGESGRYELSEIQSKELHEWIGKLPHYQGEATGMICDRTIFFMTLYENNARTCMSFAHTFLKISFYYADKGILSITYRN